MPDLPAPAVPAERAWIAERRLSVPLRAWTWLRERRRDAICDPPEAWETELRGFDPAWRQGHPSRPASRDELPVASLDALETTCGPLSLERVLLLPQTTRLVRAHRSVLTPTEVLVFGDSTVALWIDSGPGGRVNAIPVSEIAAIVDRRVLLYGRLELVAPGRSLVVRYNTVAEPALRDNLGALRSIRRGPPEPTEPQFRWCDRHGDRTAPAGVPYKWQFILRSRIARPEAGSASVAVGDVVRSGRDEGPTGVAVLTAFELAIAVEPEATLHWGRYGVDLVTVPRERLAGLAWNGRVLTVHTETNGAAGGGAHPGRASLALSLDPWLVRAMRAAFGNGVRWLDVER